MKPAIAALFALCITISVVPAFQADAQQLDMATQNQIRVKFINATRAYEAQNYNEALNRLREIETAAGGVRIATAQGLKVKVLVALDRWDEAKAELDILYGLNPDGAILEDIASAAGSIDAHYAAIAEKERKALAARQAQEVEWSDALEKAKRFKAKVGWETLLAFANKYPNGYFAADAKRAAEDALWNDWSLGGKAVEDFALEDYLKEYPNGRYAAVARRRLSELRALSDPERQELRIRSKIETYRRFTNLRAQLDEHIYSMEKDLKNITRIDTSFNELWNSPQRQLIGSVSNVEQFAAALPTVRRAVRFSKKSDCRATLKSIEQNTAKHSPLGKITDYFCRDLERGRKRYQEKFVDTRFMEDLQMRARVVVLDRVFTRGDAIQVAAACRVYASDPAYSEVQSSCEKAEVIAITPVMSLRGT
ncbi:MAG: hypothetical protein AAGH53_08400 [Pseudomonadota bacterium]